MPVLRIASVVRCSQSEGPHRRFVVWVQGCSIRCPGCCNPELFDAQGGFPVEVADLVEQLHHCRKELDIEGLSVVGGEPTEQMSSVAALCKGAQQQGLGTIVFSGQTEAQLRALPTFQDLWENLDTLVDGPFRARLREPTLGRAYVGSSNQTLHHRTQRYADPTLWQVPRSAELHLHPDGGMDLHGAPDIAVSLRRLLR